MWMEQYIMPPKSKFIPSQITELKVYNMIWKSKLFMEQYLELWDNKLFCHSCLNRWLVLLTQLLHYGISLICLIQVLDKFLIFFKKIFMWWNFFTTNFQVIFSLIITSIWALWPHHLVKNTLFGLFILKFYLSVVQLYSL